MQGVAIEEASKSGRWVYWVLAVTLIAGVIAVAGVSLRSAIYPKFVGRHPHVYLPHDDHEVETYTDGYLVTGEFGRLLREAERELPASEWEPHGSAAGGFASFQSRQAPASGRSAHEQVIVLTKRGGQVEVSVVRYSRPGLWERAKRWLASL